MPARDSLDRGTRVTITSGKYKGCRAIMEANLYGFSADNPEERAEGFQVTVFVEQVDASQRTRDSRQSR